MRPIRFDYTNVMSTAVGVHGLGEAELGALAEPSVRALAAVEARRKKDLRWLDLPYRDDVRRSILDYAASVRGRFENVCVLGIGGSALGNTALHTALDDPHHDLYPPKGRPRLFVLDNIDPEWIASFLAHVDPAQTVFNVISKSGTTAETMSQFLIVRAELVKRLGEVRHREHIVVTTDESKGVLREIARRDGYRAFAVPDGVGGRFSVLSEVGLVSSALIGIDVEALHAGAAEMDRRCKASALLQNPALLHAAIQFGLHAWRGLSMSVTFSYSHRLRNVGDWYAQLPRRVAREEALALGQGRAPRPDAHPRGRRHRPAQPGPALRRGPVRQVVHVPRVDEPVADVPIPRAYPDLEAVAYLGGRTLGELFRAEREGTRIALTEAGRPNAQLVLERIDAHSVGQLMFLLELSVAVLGEHHDVDAFDQPGVEAGKIAAYALMGRAGYEARRAEIEARTGGPRRVL